MASDALFLPKPYVPQALTKVLNDIRKQIVSAEFAVPLTASPNAAATREVHHTLISELS